MDAPVTARATDAVLPPATAAPTTFAGASPHDAAALAATAGPVRRFLRRIVGEQHVDDLASETMLALLEQSGRRAVRRPVSYALRLAWNKAVDVLRREGRTARAADPEVLDTLPAPASPRLSELREWLDAGLAKLPPADRALLHLRYDEGLDYRGLAQALGVPTGTIGWRLHNARRALARVLKDGDDGRGLPLVLMFLPALSPRVTSLAEALGLSAGTVAKVAAPSLAARLAMYAWSAFATKQFLLVFAALLGIGGVVYWMRAPDRASETGRHAHAATAVDDAAAGAAHVPPGANAAARVVVTPFQDRTPTEVMPRLTGRVVSPEGTDVAGARVSIAARGMSAGAGSSAGFDVASAAADGAPHRVITTGADGRFTVDTTGLGPLFDVVADADGFGAGIVEQVSLSAIPLEIRLARGVVVRGTVKDLEDHPVVGAHVTFRALAGRSRLTRQTTTDAEGAFTLAGLPQTDQLTLGVPGGGTTGSPTGPAHVLVEADGFAPGRMLCNLYAVDGQPTETLHVRLSRGGSVEGVVTDAMSHEPLANALVALWTVEGMQGAATERGVVYRNPFGSRIIATVRTEADGHYRFDHVPAQLGGIKLLAQGVYQVGFGSANLSRPIIGGIAVACDGFAPAGAQLGSARTEGELQTLDFALPRPATVTGRVVDQRGQPLAGMRVFASTSRRTTAHFDLVPGEAGVLGGSVLTDAAGRFRHETVPAPINGSGDAYLAPCGCDLGMDQSPGGGATVTVSAGAMVVAPDLVVTRPDTVNIDGIVRDDAGVPIAGAVVEVNAPRAFANNASANTPPVVSQGGILRLVAATSDARGAFRLVIPLPIATGGDTRPVSSVDLMITARGYALAVVPGSLTGGPVAITLHTGASIRGTVVRPDMTPVAFALVRVGSSIEDVVACSPASATARRLLATTDASGNFIIEGLPAGPVSLRALLRTDGKNSVVAGPFVAPCDGVVLTLAADGDLNPGFAFKLRAVDDATGLPPEAKLSATASDGNGHFAAAGVVGATIAFQRLPAGIYTLTVNAPGYATWTRTNFVVDATSLANATDVRLRR